MLHFNRIALLFVFIVLFVHYIFFPQFIIPFEMLFFGVMVMVLFFTGLHFFTKRWSRSSEKSFTKNLFVTSFLVKLVFFAAVLQALGERYLAEKQSARGLIPAVSFTMSETAVPNPQPAANDRNSMVLAGALLGFVLAAAALAGGLVERIFERFGRDKPPAQPR